MKQYLVLLFLFCNPVIGACQKQTNCDVLIPFFLNYSSGGVVPMSREINIYKLNSKCFASYLEPQFFIAGKGDSVWTAELDSIKILSCINFINTAKKVPNECEQIREYTRYQIAFEKDTIEIFGDCQWDGLDFYNLTGILFKERFSELERDRKHLVDSLSNQLKGNWYCAPLKNEHKEGDVLILARTKNADSDCLWEFGNDGLFKSNCNNTLDLSHSHEFLLNVESEFILRIGNGDMNKGVSDAIFTLNTVNDRELKLTFEW